MLEMPMKILVFVLFVFSTQLLFGQLVVATPGADAQIQTQTLMMTKIAAQQRYQEYQHYLEYISQFMKVVATINQTRNKIADISKIKGELKDKSAKDWLSDIDRELSGVMPEYAQYRNEISEMVGKGKAIWQGVYSDYVAGWDSNLKDYHGKLLENYENHVMFPELFPAAQKMGKDFLQNESAKKIIHKSWLESGLEYEMKNDVVRKNTFKKYYDEYLNQAKNNDNIEALGLANIMQSQYLTVETLEHLRKNSDIQAMRDHFEKDAQKAYLEITTEAAKVMEKKERILKEKSVFGLD
jgi:hypothetical protein